ncbi:hypothetical protein [Thermus sp. LT1-2-5]|uniref:hypothetical protein n=1 Tax=Thermus sp. LT1-2-5 TaxID=3026935 RepID=UPI003365AB7B
MGSSSLWARDVLFREDACRARGVGARVLAALWAFLVSLLHRRGVWERVARQRTWKAALEAFSFRPLSALRFLGLYAVYTLWGCSLGRGFLLPRTPHRFPRTWWGRHLVGKALKEAFVSWRQRLYPPGFVGA